jgi:hypothetical protein
MCAEKKNYQSLSKKNIFSKDRFSPCTHTRMSVTKQSIFSEFLLSVSEGPPRRFMKKDIPQIKLTWFCGKDFLHDALPCSGFNAQACWLFSSQWSSLSVDECASGLDDGHELIAGLCDGPASRSMGAFKRFR